MKLHQKILLDNVEYDLVPVKKNPLAPGDTIEWEGKSWMIESISGIYPSKEVYEPLVALIPDWKRHVNLSELNNAHLVAPNLKDWHTKTHFQI